MSVKQLLSKLGQMLILADPCEVWIFFFFLVGYQLLQELGHASCFVSNQKEKVPLWGRSQSFFHNLLSEPEL